MSERSFSYKDAIIRGLQMTRKYFWTALGALLIIYGLQGMLSLLNFNAGSRLSLREIMTLYPEPEAAENCYRSLVEAGYLDIYGGIQEKLQETATAADLVLPPEMEADRERIFAVLDRHRYRLPFPRPVYYLLALTLWALGFLVHVGWTKITLLLSRDQKPNLGQLFSCGPLFFKFLSATVLVALAFLGGGILLFVPAVIFMTVFGHGQSIVWVILVPLLALVLGVILVTMFMMFGYFIVDKGLGPIQSLKASYALTKGVRWRLFCFIMLTILLNIAGVLCLFIGFLFTVPASMIAFAYVYDQLRQQSEGAEIGSAQAF